MLRELTAVTWVLDITDPMKANDIYIVQLTGVEVVSALIRKTPPLTPPSLARALADFKQDYQHQYQRVAVSAAVITRAMHLVETYRLRGYDAVQLATGMEMRIVGITTRLPSLIFVCADSHLIGAAAARVDGAEPSIASLT
jgi:uncharacterized protein